jgi:hypothetical protein
VEEDKILDKVRKLLAMAEDPACTPAEAEAFTAKVAELIARYQIEEALLYAANPTRDVVGDRTVTVAAPYALNKVRLLAAVADKMGVKAVRVRSGRTTDVRVHLFGFDKDLDAVELLFNSLLIQCVHGLLAAEVPAGEHGKTFRHAWMVGFNAAIHRRLGEARYRAARQAGTSTDLVLADRSALVDQRVEQTYSHLIKGRETRVSGSGYSAGREVGNRADLGGSRMGAGRQSALSN